MYGFCILSAEDWSSYPSRWSSLSRICQGWSGYAVGLVGGIDTLLGDHVRSALQPISGRILMAVNRVY